MAIFITFGLFNLCFKSRTVSARELTFAGYAGMIRGAVAFALVMKIPHYGGHGCPKNRSVANSNKSPFYFTAVKIIASSFLNLSETISNDCAFIFIAAKIKV